MSSTSSINRFSKSFSLYSLCKPTENVYGGTYMIHGCSVAAPNFVYHYSQIAKFDRFCPTDLNLVDAGNDEKYNAVPNLSELTLFAQSRHLLHKLNSV